jgi:hypothetical protein
MRDLASVLLQAERGNADTAHAAGHRPVSEQYGIFAEFGARATTMFTDAVAKVAAGQTGPLSAMGPIPNRGDSQLLITNTALGSFGPLPR